MPGIPLTVLMPVFNGIPYLREALESILGQTFGDFEFLIVDDGSTDETPRILSAFHERDRRVRILTNPRNLGLTRSLNAALREVETEFIARMDCDDVSLPRRFAAQVDFLRKNREYAMVGSAWKEMSRDLREEIRVIRPPVGYEEIRRRMPITNLFCHSSVMMRRRPLMAVGGYPEEVPYSQDYNLWLRLIAGYKIGCLGEVLQLRRIHEGNLSRKNLRRQYRSMAHSQMEFLRTTGEPPGALYRLSIRARLLASYAFPAFLLDRLRRWRIAEMIWEHLTERP